MGQAAGEFGSHQSSQQLVVGIAHQATGGRASFLLSFFAAASQ